jgi:hypothetical protein
LLTPLKRRNPGDRARKQENILQPTLSLHYSGIFGPLPTRITGESRHNHALCRPAETTSTLILCRKGTRPHHPHLRRFSGRLKVVHLHLSRVVECLGKYRFLRRGKQNQCQHHPRERGMMIIGSAATFVATMNYWGHCAISTQPKFLFWVWCTHPLVANRKDS